jgi:hypothetical protein
MDDSSREVAERFNEGLDRGADSTLATHRPMLHHPAGQRERRGSEYLVLIGCRAASSAFRGRSPLSTNQST